jgi:hypothetical protein
MTEYRIVEEHRRFSIQVSINGHDWRGLHDIPHVPRFFDSLADARSWVATIKRGVVYHDAEDAPNLPTGTSEAPLWWSVTPNAEALDIGANRIVALFKHERQATEWARGMWGAFVLIEPVF